MHLEQQVLREYEALSAMPEISVESINRLTELLDAVCDKGILSILFCKQITPKLFYWYTEPPIWEIQEHELAIACLKNQIFAENGEVRDTDLAVNIIRNRRKNHIVRLMFNADKLQFLGFRHLSIDVANQLTTHYVVAVYCLSGIGGKTHFCINKNMGDEPVLQFLAFQRFTPQDVVCKNCEYFFKESIPGNPLLCTVHPDGPSFGYEGCIDLKLVQHQQS